MSKLEKMNEARHLVIVLGYNQKEASRIVGVAQKTLCGWSKKYEWKSIVEKTTAIRVMLNNFLRYVSATAPHNYDDIKNLSAKYINHLNGKTKKDGRISK